MADLGIGRAAEAARQLARDYGSEDVGDVQRGQVDDIARRVIELEPDAASPPTPPLSSTRR